jgi:exoribonuclease R
VRVEHRGTSSTSLFATRRSNWGTSPRRRYEDLLTVRALQYALDPDLPRRDVARELADRARGDRRPLERALRRIDRGLEQRSTAVGQRAHEVLEEALAILAADQELPLRVPDSSDGA